MSERLSSHTFSQSVLENINPIIAKVAPAVKDAAAPAGQRKGIRSPQFSPAELYTEDVFSCFNAITGNVDRLQIAVRLMQSPPRSRNNRAGIHLRDWLDYHFGSFIASTTSSFDTCLVLTNAVLRLGNRTRDCKEHLIDNSHVVSAGCSEPLKRVRKATAAFRTDRNALLHHGKTPDAADYFESEMLRTIVLASSVARLGKAIIPDHDLQPMYTDEMEKLSPKLHKFIESIMDATEPLLAALRPYYLKNLTQLTEGSR